LLFAWEYSMPGFRTVLITLLTLPLGVSPPAPPAPPAPMSAAVAPDSNWLAWKAETRTASFKLIAGIPGRAKSPFNFNGYTDGELTLTVPESATVVLNFVNEDGTPHSAQVIPDRMPLPNMALDEPAIPRAYTKAVGEGIAQFGTDAVRFRAVPAGRYLIICGVPGHGLSGMWIRLAVDPQAKTPSLAENSSASPSP
jgi:sulfocyanin